jgi:tetratricopeptide (TPR) repeat protein
MEEARKAYEEALVIRRKLAASNPDTYLPDVARVLRGIGRMHLATHNREQAGAALTEALDIFSKFAERDPAQYGRFVRLVKEDLATVAQ